MLQHTLGPLIAYGMLASNTSGLESLSSTKVLGVTSHRVSFVPRDAIMMFLTWKFATLDQLEARFNDSTANEYWSRYFSAGNVANIALSFTNTEAPNLPSVRFAPDALLHRQMIWSISNRAGSTKPSFFQTQSATEDLNTVSRLNLGASEWVTAENPQINSITFKGVADAEFDLYLSVYGRSFP